MSSQETQAALYRLDTIVGRREAARAGGKTERCGILPRTALAYTQYQRTCLFRLSSVKLKHPDRIYLSLHPRLLRTTSMSDRDQDPTVRISATLDATSELGYTRAEETEEMLQNGAMTSRCDENLLRTLLAAQNQNMMSLIEAIKGPAGTKHISLPEFDPDKPDVDARAWCTTADLCLSEVPLQGSTLIITLSKALKGSASRWLAQVSFAGMTWCDFKSLFLSRYDCVDTPAATLVKMMSSKPKEDECYAAYAARLLSTLTSRWQNMSTEQIAISTVLAHMAQFDGRIQRLAFTTEVSNRNKLQCELQAFSFLKRKASMGNSTDATPEFKRSKLQSTALKCHNCGKIGHRTPDCRSRGEVKGKGTIAATSASSSAGQKQRPDIICFRCGKTGHFATKCPQSNMWRWVSNFSLCLDRTS